MVKEKRYPIDRVANLVQNFAKQAKSGGIVLGISVILAVIIANSPWADDYFKFFKHSFGFQFDGKSFFNYSIHQWINDGLMAIFFFVLGLELKKEIVGGEFSNPANALLPIGAAIGGVIVPASIYLMLNPTGDVQSGWGIPMATDIAFALGVLSLLGDKVPVSLKIFLTALAIVDDLVAVLVIALFYTSDISIVSLSVGLGFVVVMFIGNRIGVRNILFYAILGIVGVWVAFLLSGVHATIAAVLAAFTIPADMKINENAYMNKIQNSLTKLRTIDPDDQTPTLTHKQLLVVYEVKNGTIDVIPPLQRLEKGMHPLVTFFILPIFAFSNAGISLAIDIDVLFSTNIALGVALGLIVGKVSGVVGVTLLLVKLKVAPFPAGMDIRDLFGVGLLASIGFTMSLFITSLAFATKEPLIQEIYMTQAKIGIFVASIIGGALGYILLNKRTKKTVD